MQVAALCFEHIRIYKAAHQLGHPRCRLMLARSLYLLLLLFELFELFDRRSAAWALMVDLASDVGFRTLFGLMACRILNTAHAVPMAWPAASIPSFVAAAAFSPYLKEKTEHGERKFRQVVVQQRVETRMCGRISYL
jgi:hypothetical protein